MMLSCARDMSVCMVIARNLNLGPCAIQAAILSDSRFFVGVP